MPLLPDGVLSVIALAAILGGSLYVAVARVPKAYSIALLTLGVFFFQSFLDPLVGTLGLTTEGLFAGEWWTPLTYMFLHAGFLHFFGNALILVTAGPALEERVGPRWFLLVYFLAGLAAAVAHVGFTLGGLVGGGVAVGASGAIFGILTAVAVRYPRQMLPLALGFIIIPMPAFVVLLVHLGLNLALMLSPGGTSVAWYGHFAGYFVGFAAALFFEKRAIGVAGPGGATRVPKARLPDVGRLAPLARTPAMREMLDKAAAFSGEHQGDAEFRWAWIDRFVAKARCPSHDAPLTRHGTEVYCPHGDYRLDFAAR